MRQQWKYLIDVPPTPGQPGTTASFCWPFQWDPSSERAGDRTIQGKARGKSALISSCPGHPFPSPKPSFSEELLEDRKRPVGMVMSAHTHLCGLLTPLSRGPATEPLSANHRQVPDSPGGPITHNPTPATPPPHTQRPSCFQALVAEPRGGRQLASSCGPGQAGSHDPPVTSGQHHFQFARRT